MDATALDVLGAVRRGFAESLRVTPGIRSEAVVRAFASVPRERFVGPGPWLVSDGSGYRKTPDADPAQLYANVRVAIDASRELNNGMPHNHALWLDALGPRAGEHLVHVGAGTGYYSALLAATVGPSGRVTAIEIDAALASRLHHNLADVPNARAVHGDGVSGRFAPADGIYVNAGLGLPPVAWLNALTRGGRMILPLAELGPTRRGAVLRVERVDAGWAARFIGERTDLRIFPCAGGRDVASDQRLATAFARGDHDTVRSVRTDPHAPEASCWLHTDGCCISRAPR